jgi:hypothetical protein
MRHERHKHVRDMRVVETPQGRGQLTEIKVRCDDNGTWQINGSPVPTDADAMVAAAQVLTALAYERDVRRGGHPASHDRAQRGPRAA